MYVTLRIHKNTRIKRQKRETITPWPKSPMSDYYFNELLRNTEKTIRNQHSNATVEDKP
jgi:hypothetical protein